MGTLNITVTQSFGSQVISKQKRTVTIVPFNRGTRKILSATDATTVTMTADLTLVDTDKAIQFLDPNGSTRNVILPAGASTNHGFVIYNLGEGTEIITVKDSSLNTLGTVYPGNAGWFLSADSIYKGAGGGSAELDELADVDINNVADEELLQYNATTSKWENVSGFSMPRQASFIWREAVTTVTIDKTITGTTIVHGVWRNTTANAADGDEYYFYPLLEAGTYEILIVGTKYTYYGISDLYVNGIEEGSFDWYASSQANNVEFLTTGITISTSGRQEIKIKVDGKNASSSDYVLGIGMVFIRRTGD